MGIIRRASQAGKASRSKTVIADGCVIQGELRSEGDLHLDGRFDGVIRAVHFSIGNTGAFSGDVYATHVTISGRMEGKIACDVLEMLNGCHVSAEVQCQDLVIEKGAKFVGTSHGASGVTLVAEQNALPPVATASLIAPKEAVGTTPTGTTASAKVETVEISASESSNSVSSK